MGPGNPSTYKTDHPGLAATYSMDIPTWDRRQSIMLILSTSLDQKSLETEFFYCFLSPVGPQICLEAIENSLVAIENINTINKRRSKSLETEFLIAICCQSGDKWQTKTLFLRIFDPCSSTVKSIFKCRLSGVIPLVLKGLGRPVKKIS